MEHTYLPEKAPTKREQIRDLVLGDHTCAYSADDIARIVQTTKENVWKEKSRMGNEGLLVRRRTLNVSAEGKEETMLLIPSVAAAGAGQSRTKGRSNDDHYTRYLNITPIDSEGIRKMYTGFKNKEKPVDIIVQYGFRPSVVELEYSRFLKLDGLDMDALQNYIGKEISKYPEEVAERLEKNYKQNGYLTTAEIIEFVTMKHISYRNQT